MYLLHRAGGYLAQETLWTLRSAGRLALHELSETDVKALTRALEKISTHARPLRPGRIRSSTP